MVREAMIVAGGAGTRLHPLTATTPKPLLPLATTPMLAGMVRRLAAAGITRVSLVVGADTTPFEQLVAPMAAHGVTVRMVPEPEPLDTAGGVRSAIRDVHGPVVVCNGDVLTDVDVAALVAAHERAGADATLSLIRVADTSSFGVCVRDGTRIVDFVEKPAPGTLPGQDTVNAGTYVLEPAAMRAFPSGPLSFERTVFPGILASGGHIEGSVWDGVWTDLGTPQRYRRGHRLVLDGAMAWPGVDAVADRGDGVRVAPSATVDADVELVGPVLVADGARIVGGASLGPHVTVGRRCRVGRAARLRDCVLMDGAVVGDAVTVVDGVLGNRSVIEAGAHVGRDVVVGDDVVVAAGCRVPDHGRLGADGLAS